MLKMMNSAIFFLVATALVARAESFQFRVIASRSDSCFRCSHRHRHLHRQNNHNLQKRQNLHYGLSCPIRKYSLDRAQMISLMFSLQTKNEFGLADTLLNQPLIGKQSIDVDEESDKRIDDPSDKPIDKRPHEQRVSGPRKARRLNHPFQHLYRHSDPWWDDNEWVDGSSLTNEHQDDYKKVLEFASEAKENVTHLDDDLLISENESNSSAVSIQIASDAIRYLREHGGYSLEEIGSLHADFPPLLELDVIRHLRPKMRFLKGCLDGGMFVDASTDGNSNEIVRNGKNATISNKSNAMQKHHILHPKLKKILPANFYGARLERTVAPRHAFLVHVGLPSGRALWDKKMHWNQENGYNEESGRTNSDGPKRNKSSGVSLLEEFLVMHRKPKQFAALCNDWKRKYGCITTNNANNLPITSEQIVAFDKLFQRGLLSAARNDSTYIFPDELENKDTENSKKKKRNHLTSSPSPLQTANVTSAQLLRYLIQHGANPYETDVRGASLFHWAAGCGNLEGLMELVDCCNSLEFGLRSEEISDEQRWNQKEEGKIAFPKNPGAHAALLWKASRDHATPLHWAAAGAGPKEFGIGGHLHICNYILSLSGTPSQFTSASSSNNQIISERKLINAQTKDGNTILMWAAWSKSLEIVKMLIRNRADSTIANRNGCTVAHWAASGGSLAVCQYLAQMANVDFTTENYAGNTPLSHAVAYGRLDVVRWLREDMGVEDTGGTAEGLAMEFVNWADMGLKEEEDERRQVYDLFQDWRKEMGENDGDLE